MAINVLFIELFALVLVPIECAPSRVALEELHDLMEARAAAQLGTSLEHLEEGYLSLAQNAPRLLLTLLSLELAPREEGGLALSQRL